MKVVTFSLLLAFNSFSFPAFATPDPSASVLLDRMSHSFRELNYRGIFTYHQGEKMESFRITHAVIDGEEYERLEYLDGEPRDIVRRGHSLSCMHPGHQLIRIYQKQQNSTSGQAEVGRYYQFVISGDGRVAGRDVVEMAVTPMDSHRFGYVLALDVETGLLLRSVLIGAKDEVLEKFQFVEVTMEEEIPKADFQTGENSYHAGHNKPLKAISGKAQNTSQLPWNVSWLPGGFTSTVPGGSQGAVTMRTYTDGLTVFSVFLEGVGDSGENTEGTAQKGATIAYSMALMLDNHPYRVTVVGEIPHMTAKKIAKSVTLVEL